MIGISRSEIRGFTLVELMTVLVVIGVLAGIALAQFSEYRSYAFDSRAKSDLRNVATAEESYFIDTEEYKSCTLLNGTGSCSTLQGVGHLSGGVNLQVVSVNDEYFTATSSHSNGSGVTYSWNSDNGGLQN
jgi:prepilin-type N-terminal cleavage/methylation domain-containing protein